MKEAARQGGVFLAMIYAGLAAGILYDILRGIRRLLRAGPVVTGVLDVLFGMLAFVPAAVLVAQLSHEGLRSYMLLGMASGFLLYLAGVSRVVQAFLRALGRLGRRLLATRLGLFIARLGKRVTK